MQQTYPILEYDPAPEGIIEPRKLIRPIDAPERCVICFFQEVITRLAGEGRLTLISTRKSEIGEHPVYEMAVDGQRLALFHPGVGAPLSAGLLDEVIALGLPEVYRVRRRGRAGSRDRGRPCCRAHQRRAR